MASDANGPSGANHMMTALAPYVPDQSIAAYNPGGPYPNPMALVVPKQSLAVVPPNFPPNYTNPNNYLQVQNPQQQHQQLQHQNRALVEQHIVRTQLHYLTTQLQTATSELTHYRTKYHTERAAHLATKKDLLGKYHAEADAHLATIKTKDAAEHNWRSWRDHAEDQKQDLTAKINALENSLAESRQATAEWARWGAVSLQYTLSTKRDDVAALKNPDAGYKTLHLDISRRLDEKTEEIERRKVELAALIEQLQKREKRCSMQIAKLDTSILNSAAAWKSSFKDKQGEMMRLGERTKELLRGLEDGIAELGMQSGAIEEMRERVKRVEVEVREFEQEVGATEGLLEESEELCRGSEKRQGEVAERVGKLAEGARAIEEGCRKDQVVVEGFVVAAEKKMEEVCRHITVLDERLKHRR